MSPLYIICAFLIAGAWGYVVYRFMKKHGVDRFRGYFDAQTLGMPSSLRPFHFTPEIEDSKGDVELLEEHPIPKHPNHNGGNPHPF